MRNGIIGILLLLALCLAGCNSGRPNQATEGQLWVVDSGPDEGKLQSYNGETWVTLESDINPAEDIVDALIVVPQPIVDRFDDSERTRMVYNIALMREFVVKHEKRLISLEAVTKATAELSDIKFYDTDGKEIQADEVVE